MNEDDLSDFELESGVTYSVITTFKDIDDELHPEKESWQFERWQVDEAAQIVTFYIKIDGAPLSFRIKIRSLKYFGDCITKGDISYKRLKHAYDTNEFNLHRLYRKLNDKNIKSKTEENLFHLAAAYADTKAIEMLMEWNVKPNEDIYESTAFETFAGSMNYSKCATRYDDIYRTTVLLLKAGVSPTRGQPPPYYRLACKGIYPAIKVLIENKVRMNGTWTEGKNILHAICSSPNARNKTELEIAKKIIPMLLESKSIDPEDKDIFGTTPLEYATREIAALFPDDPNAQKTDDDGLALRQALRDGDIEVVKTLLAGGVDPNEASPETGWTPLMIVCRNDFAWRYRTRDQPPGAEEKSFFEMVKLLLKQGPDVNLKSSDDETALSFLLTDMYDWRKLRLLDLLIEHGLDPNVPVDAQGNTALNYVCQKSFGEHMNYKAAEKLLDAGANPSGANNVGMTPLMLYAANGEAQDLEVAELLISRGADVNAVNNDGYTALMYAAENSEVHGRCIAEIILDTGVANTEKVNNRNKTALDIAIENSRASIVKLLLK